MRTLYKAVAYSILAVFSLTACATTQNGQPRWSSPQACIAAHTVGGTLLGAAGGAIVGVLLGGGKGAATGAVAGGVTGGVVSFAYAWGACFAAFTKVNSQQTKGFSETRSEIGYKPQRGTVTKIHDYTIDPAAIAPGDQPTLHASYYVMTPENKEITVTETLILKVYNPEKKVFEEVGSSSETIVMNPGKRKATSEIPIPTNAEEGKFFIVFKVATLGQTDQMEMPLTITKDQKILAKAKRESQRRIAKTRKEEPTVVASAESTVENTSEQPTETGAKNIGMASDKQIVITAKKANLRENPDAQSKIISKASQNEKYPLLTTVTVSGKQWYQISLSNEKSAWILASLSKVVE